MLLVPISGKIGWKNPPVVTLALVVINCLVFFLFQTGDDKARMAAEQFYLESGLAQIEVPHYIDYLAASGKKTRDFKKILLELERAFQIHQELGTILGGVHFELTGENVTECIGGARGLTEGDLSRAYRSQVDPRLNYEQALETAMLISRLMTRFNNH